MTVPPELIDAAFAFVGALFGWLAKRFHVNQGPK